MKSPVKKQMTLHDTYTHSMPAKMDRTVYGYLPKLKDDSRNKNQTDGDFLSVRSSSSILEKIKTNMAHYKNNRELSTNGSKLTCDDYNDINQSKKHKFDFLKSQFGVMKNIQRTTQIEKGIVMQGSQKLEAIQ